jgi:hypothetical protein
MAISDNSSLPITIHITSTASPEHEVTTLTKATIAKCFVSNEKPERLIGDKAYDSDPQDVKLAAECSVELIALHRLSYRRKRPKKTQDGRSLRRYKHWWTI